MSNQLVVNRVKESIIDLSLTALEGKETVDELEHKIFNLYQPNELMPVITSSVRRLFPTYIEHKYPAAFSQEARAAMSGILFGLIILENLPIDKDAAKYVLSRDLLAIPNKDEFCQRGVDCLIEIDFVPEAIPRISLVESTECDLELWAGFGLVVSESLEVYDLQHNYASPKNA